MTYTQAQIDSLRSAIATGALTLRNANGEFVTYRSLSEMRQILATMEAAANPSARSRRDCYPRYERWPSYDPNDPG